MVKLLIGALLSLTAVNAVAGNVFIYEDEGQKSSNAVTSNMYTYKHQGGQVLLTNVNPSGNFDKFTKNVKVTHYVDKDDTHKSKKVNKSNKMKVVSYGTLNSIGSASYSNSAYAALR